MIRVQCEDLSSSLTPNELAQVQPDETPGGRWSVSTASGLSTLRAKFPVSVYYWTECQRACCCSTRYALTRRAVDATPTLVTHYSYNLNLNFRADFVTSPPPWTAPLLSPKGSSPLQHLKMFSSRLLRLPPALRTISRLPGLSIPKPSPAASRQQPLNSHLFIRHYAYPPPPPGRRPQRVVHYRFDPEGASRAKPLLTVEQVRNTVGSPSFRYILIFAAGSGVVFYVANLETVPVSGRRRFNCYSEATVEKEGELMYRKIMAEAMQQGAILSPRDRRSRMVQRVMDRLIPASGLEHVPWEVHVIESPGVYHFRCTTFAILSRIRY